jgi:hypothetical protein
MQRYGRNADCKDQFYPLWFGCIENELNRSKIFNNLKIISCILGKNQFKFLRIAWMPIWHIFLVTLSLLSFRENCSEWREHKGVWVTLDHGLQQDGEEEGLPAGDPPPSGQVEAGNELHIETSS